MSGVRILLASLAAAAASRPAAQELLWQDPGNYDHAGHQAKTPGDPDIPAGIPPGFAGSLAHPDALRIQPTGMGFLPDGRMVLAHWGGFGRKGMIYLLDGMAGDRQAIKAAVIARDLWEPFGLKVLGDTVWYMAQDGLFRLVRGAAGPESWKAETASRHILPIKDVGVDFPIVFNAAYHAGSFYYSLGAYKNFNPPGKNEGYVVRIDRATGAQEILARGIRMPNGLAAGAAGDLFLADNQGEYRPSSAVFHVVKGRHYGMAAPDGREGNLGGAMTRMLPLPPADSIFPPAVHVPYRPGSASLTNLFHLDQGPFAGQFLAGDNAYGGVHRIQVEKVKGEYQGACFQFSGLLEAGIQSFARGPDGSIYGGGLGMGANGWSWLGREHGLMRWKADGTPLQAMVSVHSQREGFDIRFSEPLGPGAANPDLWWVSSWHYQPTPAYGGARLDIRKLRITRIRTSADRRVAALAVDGLQPGRVYRIMIAPELRDSAGRAYWTRNAWYTLNRISEAAPLSGGATVSPVSGPGPAPAADFLPGASALRIRVRGAGPFTLRIFGPLGNLQATYRGRGPALAAFPWPAGRPGLRYVTLDTPAGRAARVFPAAHAPGSAP